MYTSVAEFSQTHTNSHICACVQGRGGEAHTQGHRGLQLWGNYSPFLLPARATSPDRDQESTMEGYWPLLTYCE